MGGNSKDILSMILDLAGLVSGEDYIGTHKIDKSVPMQTLLNDLRKITGQQFRSNPKDWASWYKDNYKTDEQEKICLQFAIVVGQAERIKGSE